MKKLLSISLLLGMLFLYGCSSSSKLSADQLFEKKQECVSYKSEIEKDIEKGGYKDGLITDIFYSTKRNSCLYEFNASSNSLTLVDYFSKEILGYANINCDEKYYETCIAQQKVLFDKIKELKGE